ncbi:MAG: serpin family protein [Verrucomicrobia bacterium]|nr:serpin family protein [Verrucomicrobiota bacterium]
MNRQTLGNFSSLWFTFLTLGSFASIEARAAFSADQQKLASANTGFAFKLLKEIAKEQPAQNVFISPYSVSSVLQMVCNGAGGKTKAEMQQVLGTSGMTLAAMNQANQNLHQAITTSCSNVVLNSANAIWYRKGMPVKPEFIACNQRFYQARVEGLDFNDPASVGIMNAWVNDMTRGRIPSIVSGPIYPLTDLYLANAVYFKGGWFVPFEAKETKERVFHLRGGQQKKLPMMTRTGDFSYRRGTGYQAVRLPYKDWNMAMYVFLPGPNSSPEKLVAIMNGDNWQRITLPGFSEKKGTLVLPRFKLEYAVDLKKPLRAMGLRHAFEAADFSGMSSVPLFISEALQKSFVEVNEEGTEAAAVTFADIAGGIEMNPPKPFEMIVDRPFLFVIHHSADTGSSILFMGMVSDPDTSTPQLPRRP